jgi:hypothetical protein
MTPPDPLPGLDLEAGAFHDLTLAFDAFHRRPDGADGVARLSRRRFLRCNLTGPAPVTLGPGARFADCIFSACAFTALPDEAPAPGTILVDDCSFDDCVLTRWTIFVPPVLLPSLLRDMPRMRVFGLPFG